MSVVIDWDDPFWGQPGHNTHEAAWAADGTHDGTPVARAPGASAAGGESGPAPPAPLPLSWSGTR